MYLKPVMALNSKDLGFTVPHVHVLTTAERVICFPVTDVAKKYYFIEYHSEHMRFLIAVVLLAGDAPGPTTVAAAALEMYSSQASSAHDAKFEGVSRQVFGQHHIHDGTRVGLDVIIRIAQNAPVSGLAKLMKIAQKYDPSPYMNNKMVFFSLNA